ncbi:hypothetical protein HHI36_023904, partial [Cryptolaemus montrouzieri]
ESSSRSWKTLSQLEDNHKGLGRCMSTDVASRSGTMIKRTGYQMLRGRAARFRMPDINMKKKDIEKVLRSTSHLAATGPNGIHNY